MGSSPRLIETSLERKCVQKGEEVDIKECDEDMEGLKAVYPKNVPKGPSITSVDPREASTGELLPEVVNT